MSQRTAGGSVEGKENSVASQAERVAKNRDLALAYRLSLALAVVAVVASAVGVFFPAIFRDPAMTVGNARGTALVILVVAVPALVISMILATKGSLRAQLVWAGVLAYVLYNSVFFAFAMTFNVLFLFYVAMFSLALWSLVVLLVKLNADYLRAHFAPTTPVRALAIYLLIIAALFAVVWLKDIVPAIVANTTPAGLAGTKMLTNPVQVLDLSITLPLCVLAGIWLWRRRSWGYVLSGVLLAMLVIETASIATDQVFGHLHDPEAPLGAVPVFVVLTLIGLVPTVALLRNLRTEQNTKVR
jgi:hypothetical protein